MQRVTFKITEVKVYEHSVLMPRGFSERAARKKARLGIASTSFATILRKER